MGFDKVHARKKSPRHIWKKKNSRQEYFERKVGEFHSTLPVFADDIITHADFPISVPIYFY